MNKDKLIILKQNFIDPAFPDQTFYCWHCAIIEGVLKYFPELNELIDVERISWSQPRGRLIELLGEGCHSVPVLILKDHLVQDAEKHHSISNVHEILDALSDRHGIAKPHP